MLDWGMKQLETVLGKTVTGIIGVFALGIFVMWAMPKYVVTTEIFKREVESIYKEMNKGDKWQKLKLIELKKDIWDRRLWDLLKEIDKEGKSLTTIQENLIEEANKKLERLNEDEAEIRKSLEQ